jgi:predicted RNase H-like HicB family nuclease
MVAVVALIDGRPGAYGISFPDFPGAVAGGASVDEALRRGRENLAFHIESMGEVGEALPRVRDIAEVRADPEFVGDFAGAGMVALVDVTCQAGPCGSTSRWTHGGDASAAGPFLLVRDRGGAGSSESRCGS